ncbi:MAG: hypothetical protein AAF990_24305 [Bacteroidota bacterium]
MKTISTFIFCLFLVNILSAQEEQAAPVKEQIYQVVKEMPRFPGCENLDKEHLIKKCASEKMQHYLKTHPAIVALNENSKEKSKVVFRLIVRKTGKAELNKILSVKEGTPPEGYEQAIATMVEEMPTWRPGSHGRPGGPKLSVYYNLVIRFGE